MFVYMIVQIVSSPYLLVFGDDCVHGTRSRWCCRWIWWGLKTKRG